MTWFTRASDAIARFFIKDVEPVVISFIQQFATEFGKAALAQAAVAANDVRLGVPIKDAANNSLKALETAGLNIAIKGAEDVMLNAIRVHLSVPVTYAPLPPV